MKTMLKLNLTKVKSLYMGLVAGFVFMACAEGSLQARPQYYSGLAKVTPAIVNHEKVVMIDFGGQVAMVTDRPERTHEIVDPAKMVSFINDSHDVTAVVIRPY